MQAEIPHGSREGSRKKEGEKEKRAPSTLADTPRRSIAGSRTYTRGRRYARKI